MKGEKVVGCKGGNCGWGGGGDGDGGDGGSGDGDGSEGLGGGGEGLGGGGDGDGGKGDADGGSASHKLQVFLHCSLLVSEYVLHFFFLHVKSFASSAHAGGGGDGDGGDGDGSEGLGGGGKGLAGGGEGEADGSIGGGGLSLLLPPRHWQAPSMVHGHHWYPFAHLAQASSEAYAAFFGTATQTSHDVEHRSG